METSSAAAQQIDAGLERAAALAKARSELRDKGAQTAEASRSRSSEKLAETREAISRALGANTRLSIQRAPDALRFVYKAIDVNTGEIVNEWPEATFLELVRGVRDDVRQDVDQTGLLLDDLA